VWNCLFFDSNTVFKNVPSRGEKESAVVEVCFCTAFANLLASAFSYPVSSCFTAQLGFEPCTDRQAARGRCDPLEESRRRTESRDKLPNFIVSFDILVLGLKHVIS
jgi:hypothetical protein